MTKLMFVSVLWLASACKPEMAVRTAANITALEASPCWSEKEAMAQLETIRQLLNQGEDFAKLASVYSQDPGSSGHGGNLGWTEKGMMVPEYEKAMLALQPGEIAAPVKTEFGYHLIQLQEVMGERYQTRHIWLRLCQ